MEAYSRYFRFYKMHQKAFNIALIVFFYKYPKKVPKSRVSVFGIGTNTEIPPPFRYRYIPVPNTDKKYRLPSSDHF